MPPSTRSVLSPADLEHFAAHGFVRVPGAFSRDLALELQDAVWEELRGEHGIEREDRATWRQPPKSPGNTKLLEANHALEDHPFAAAIGELVGRTDWPRPRSWGGFLVTFPTHVQLAASPSGWHFPPEDAWHWDWPPERRGLLVVSFYSEVRPGGGGTRVLSGSHHLLRAYYEALTPAERALPRKEHRKRFAGSHPWITELMRKGRGSRADKPYDPTRHEEAVVNGVPCRVVELCGSPGDAVFCNLGILHTPTPNGADTPRIMRVKFLTLDAGD